jgi:hypothetical protein
MQTFHMIVKIFHVIEQTGSDLSTVFTVVRSNCLLALPRSKGGFASHRLLLRRSGEDLAIMGESRLNCRRILR